MDLQPTDPDEAEGIAQGVTLAIYWLGWGLKSLWKGISAEIGAATRLLSKPASAAGVLPAPLLPQNQRQPILRIPHDNDFSIRTLG
jgi:hypothetical protein